MEGSMFGVGISLARIGLRNLHEHVRVRTKREHMRIIRFHLGPAADVSSRLDSATPPSAHEHTNTHAAARYRWLDPRFRTTARPTTPSSSCHRRRDAPPAVASPPAPCQPRRPLSPGWLCAMPPYSVTFLLRSGHPTLLYHAWRAAHESAVVWSRDLGRDSQGVLLLLVVDCSPLALHRLLSRYMRRSYRKRGPSRRPISPW